MTNGTFRAPENSCMFITGSLPSLGSWDAKRARKMNPCPDSPNTWSLALYVPERSEFLYQYVSMCLHVKCSDAWIVDHR